MIDPITDYANEVIELRSGVDFYDYAVKYHLPLLEPHGLDYPKMGSWQPATEVFKKMDVDRFTIPVTVEWVDNIKKMKGYIDATEAGTKEVQFDNCESFRRLCE